MSTSLQFKIGADIADIRAKLAAVRADIHSLTGTVNLRLNNTQLAADIAHARTLLASLGGTSTININTGNLEKTLKKLVKAMRELVTEISTLRGSLGGGLGGGAAAADVARLERELRNLRAQIDSMRGSSAGVGSAFAGLRGQIAQLLSAFAGLYGVHLFLSVTDEAKRFEGQLRLVTDSQQQLIDVQRKLTASANATGTELSGSIALFSKLKLATTSLNGTSDDMLVRLSDITNKFVALGGAPIETANAALFQFGQALGKGKLNGDEFVSIMEGALPLANAMAQGMGMTIGQFTQAANDQKITTELMINSLLKMGATADEQFGKLPRTSAAAMTELKRQVKDAFAAWDRSVGLSASVIEKIQYVSENLQTVLYWIGVIGAATGFRLLIAGILAARTALLDKVAALRTTQQANIANTQATLFAARAAAAQAALELQLATTHEAATVGTAAHTAALLRLTNARIADAVATRAQTTAQTAATAAQAAGLGAGRALLGMLGGPVGLAAIALSVGAAFLLMGSNADSAKDSLEALGNTAEEQIDNFRKLALSQKVPLLLKLKVEIDGAKEAMKAATERFKTALQHMKLSANTPEQRNLMQSVFDQLTSGAINTETAFARLNGKLKLNATSLKELSDAASDWSINSKKLDEKSGQARDFKAATDQQVGNQPAIDAANTAANAANTQTQATFQNIAKIVGLAKNQITDPAKEKQLAAALEQVRLGASGASDAMVKLLGQWPEVAKRASLELRNLGSSRAEFTKHEKIKNNLEAANRGETTTAQGGVTTKPVAASVNHDRDRQVKLKAAIDGEEGYSQKKRNNIIALNRLEIKLLNDELAHNKSNAGEQEKINRQILEKRLEGENALKSFDKSAADAAKTAQKEAQQLSKQQQAEAKRQREYQLETAVLEIQGEKQAAEFDAQTNELAFKQGIRGVDSYFEEKINSINTIAAIEERIFDAKIAAETDANKETELRQQKNALEKKRLFDVSAVQAEQKKADEERKASENQLQIDLANAEGRHYDARMLEIKAKFAKLIDDLKKQGRESDVVVAVKIQKIEISKADADEAQKKANEILERQQRKENAIVLAAGENPTLREKAAADAAILASRQTAAVDLAPHAATLNMAKTAGVDGLDTQIDDLNNKILELGRSVPTTMDLVKNSIVDLGKAGISSAIDGLSDSFMALVDGSKSAGEAFKDFVRGMVMAMAQMVAKTLATVLVLQGLSLVTGIPVATLAQFAGIGLSVAGGGKSEGAPVDVIHRHTGGIADGGGTSRKVNPAVFTAAPRYHVGGIAGLKSGEVPAILEKGEEVLTRKDPRHVANGGKNAADGGGNGSNNGVRIVNVIDPNLMQDYVASSAGERVIINLLERNAGTIRQLLG